MKYFKYSNPSNKIICTAAKITLEINQKKKKKKQTDQSKKNGQDTNRNQKPTDPMK